MICPRSPIPPLPNPIPHTSNTSDFCFPSPPARTSPPPPPTPGPGADSWTHGHELVLSRLPLSQPLGLPLHLSPGWAAHQGRVRVQARTGAQLRRAAPASQSAIRPRPRHNPNCLAQLLLSTGPGGGAKGRTRRPTRQQPPHPAPLQRASRSCPDTAGSRTGDLRPPPHLVSSVRPHSIYPIHPSV